MKFKDIIDRINNEISPIEKMFILNQIMLFLKYYIIVISILFLINISILNYNLIFIKIDI